MRNASRNQIFSEAALPKLRFTAWLEQQQIAGNFILCRCTRPLNVVKAHCANCGSTNVYASRLGPQVLQTGEEVTAVQYKCRKCGIYFTDVEGFYHCEAPELQPTMREVRKRVKTESVIQAAGFNSKSDFIERLAAFRKSQGTSLEVNPLEKEKPK